MTSPTDRTGADRCPGALQPFSAEDGLIVRARIPGGQVTTATLSALMRLAVAHGTPRIQLTTRANLQIRGLPDPLPEIIPQRIADAGLLPSTTHERARNILAAPSGERLGRRARDLDRLLQRRPRLAQLPGRFLMLLTDSGGVGLTEPYDLAYVESGASGGLLLVGGAAGAGRVPPAGGTGRRTVLGRRADPAVALHEMLDLAERFLSERPDERTWNIRDLSPGSPLLNGFAPVTVAVGAPLLPGTRGGDLVAGVPLGLLEPRQLDALRAVSDTVTVTPWRSVLVPGGAAHAEALAAAGLVTTPDSSWARISACPGAPHCARAVSETLSLARDCAATLPASGPRLHLVGCERRCGSPRTEHVAVVGARGTEEVREALARSVPSSP